MSRFKKTFLFHAIRFFRLRDSSERVARGFAVGTLPNFFPTFGFGVLVSGFVARIFGGNLAAGFVGGASLTLMWPVLFYLNMQIGGLFFTSPILIDEVQDIQEDTASALMWGKTFFVGALVNGTVFGIVSYILILTLYKRMQPGALAWLRFHSRAIKLRRPQTKQAALV